jgi:hypothetical protein
VTSPEPILFLVSRGLLEHKDRMGAAIWEYLWFLDRVTKDDPDGNGKFNGLVLGGAPFKAELIAHDLHEHVKTVLQNVRKLEAEGYIIRRRHTGNLCSFTVTNSKKWFWRRRIENTPSDAGGSENAPSEGAQPLPRGSETTPAYKERQDRDTTKNKTNGTAFDASQISLPSWLPQDAWQEFVQHRKDQKNPLTELAAKKTIKKMETLRAEGNDPRAVIDQTIANCWTALYPISDRKGSNGSAKPPKVEYLSDKLEREKARLQ